MAGAVGSELSSSQQDQGAGFNDFDFGGPGSICQCAVLSPGVHDDSARSCADDVVDQRSRAGFVEINRNRVDRLRRRGNGRKTLFAEDFVQGGINRQNAVSVFAQHFQRFAAVTIRLRRSAENRNCLSGVGVPASDGVWSFASGTIANGMGIVISTRFTSNVRICLSRCISIEMRWLLCVNPITRCANLETVNRSASIDSRCSVVTIPPIL